jgi:Rrf2 family protein
LCFQINIMFLNRTTKYAISLLTYMVKDQETVYSAEFLHRELNIPRRYLRLLLTDLSKHGFIVSSRGRSGGFRLGKGTEKISIASIIDTMEGLESYDNCFFGIKNCTNGKPCAMHDTWNKTRSQLMKTLEDTSLEELGKDSLMKF